MTKTFFLDPAQEYKDRIKPAALRARGARFVVEPHSPRPGLKIAFLEGPEKLRIELLERAAG